MGSTEGPGCNLSGDVLMIPDSELMKTENVLQKHICVLSFLKP